MSEAAIMERPAPAKAELVKPAQESQALAPPAAEHDPYVGIAQVKFSKEQQDILIEPCDVSDLDILPTGEVYLSQVGYRRRLIKAFGVGGWALRPFGKPTMHGKTLMQEWALYAEGRFVSSAWGEADYQERNDRHSYATAAEALKSNGLMRCCKDLGIASECWDKRFTSKFQKDHCVKVWRTKQGRDKQGEFQWRRKDADPFYDEEKGRGGKRQRQPDDVPSDTDAMTGEIVSEQQPPVDPQPLTVKSVETKKNKRGDYWRVVFSDGRSAFTEDRGVADLARACQTSQAVVAAVTESKNGGLVLAELAKLDAAPAEAKPF